MKNEGFVTHKELTNYIRNKVAEEKYVQKDSISYHIANKIYYNKISQKGHSFVTRDAIIYDINEVKDFINEQIKLLPKSKL